MPSGEGSLAVMIGYLLSSRTGCNLFNWVQRHVLRCEQIRSFMPVVRNVAVTTFMELNTVLWTCYLLLLFVYDNALLGDRHPVAYVVAFGPLFRTLYLFARLIRYKRTGSAIRYAVPTVIIFWNFVEILRRASFILLPVSRLSD
ncbi:hypothetical protein [Porphyromonas gingivalis]|uniref:hypothetical protein n=1 Tax=Porphyromonas gingivalis TaxID=837 RepID=UPI0003252966|nr:hypothetical protein [Porphyromonas gingivalis]AIJ35108.1 hypothetical protein EG14_03245 [Porphyromonas gingivalis]ALJ24932.1 hypothetical protein PGF_00004640 [Porphyromonas gingivalis 381]MDR4976218.1 hypothetical protein [Porphyromonas gingivalis]HBW78318.1 hypothetical protein [Porphyromonas gingivalis]